MILLLEAKQRICQKQRNCQNYEKKNTTKLYCCKQNIMNSNQSYYWRKLISIHAWNGITEQLLFLLFWLSIPKSTVDNYWQGVNTQKVIFFFTFFFCLYYISPSIFYFSLQYIMLISILPLWSLQKVGDVLFFCWFCWSLKLFFGFDLLLMLFAVLLFEYVMFFYV